MVVGIRAANGIEGPIWVLMGPHRHHVGLGLLAHHGDAMGLVAQRAKAGDVIGVQMRVHRLDQFEVKLAHKL